MAIALAPSTRRPAKWFHGRTAEAGWNAFERRRVQDAEPKEVSMRHPVAQILLGILLIASAGDSRPAAQPAPKPLFDRLGGVYSIATVVDDVIERLLVNDTLNANPAISEAGARVPKAGLKFQVTALVCEVTGGPCKYGGRSMKDAHAHLNINEVQWQAMMTDSRKTLDTFKVPAKEQEELVAIVDSTKKDIVKGSIP
jgi:hemoglobin